MPFTLTMPKLSPTMEEGTITTWFKKEGDFVQVGDLLMEVSTDKAQVEYQAIDEGYLRKIVVKEGSGAVVNDLIAVFSENKEEDIKAFLKDELKKTEKKPVLEEKKNPEKKEESEAVNIQETAHSFMTFEPFGEIELPSRYQSHQQSLKASPLAKKIAEQQGLDLNGLKGSGPGGRIVKKDLVYAVKKNPVSFATKPKIPEKAGGYTALALTPMRKSIAQRLQSAKASIPHYYVTVKVDAMPMLNTRVQLKEMGLKISVNDFIVKACSLALKMHPEINRGYNSKDNTLIQFESIDICVAVSLDAGLITPILFHADYKNLGQLSQEIKTLASLAKEGKLKPHQYQGGSFTISNLGMFGVENFQAVINPPQAAILAVAGVIEEPVIKEGRIDKGSFMKLCLSSDHRVIDGAQAATFLTTLKKFLENPSSLLL